MWQVVIGGGFDGRWQIGDRKCHKADNESATELIYHELQLPSHSDIAPVWCQNSENFQKYLEMRNLTICDWLPSKLDGRHKSQVDSETTSPQTELQNSEGSATV